MLKDIVNKINKDNKGRVAPLQREYDLLYKEISAIQYKKNKVLGLYEEGMISKDDLASRLTSLNERKNLLEDRIEPIMEILNQYGVKLVSLELVRVAIKSFI